MLNHKHITSEFRQKAVDLLLSSGRPLKQVAAELGITANSLRTWRDRALGNGHFASTLRLRRGSLRCVPVANAVEEIRRLQREVDYLRRQREILKKAMSILSEDARRFSSLPPSTKHECKGLLL